MRVLHAPTNTGAHPQGLATAERSLGIKSHAVALKLNYLDMPVDEVLWPKGMRLLAQARAQIELIRRAARDFDIIHYNGGQTISTLVLRTDTSALPLGRRLKIASSRTYGAQLQAWELGLLRRSRRPHFVTYQGSDARQRDYCQAHFDITNYNEPESKDVPGADEHIRWQIGVLTRNAAKVYAVNPDLLHMLPQGAEFLPYASVDPRDWRPCWQDARRPLIVHAPTRRWLKGTRYVTDAVERLRGAGYDFDFELVEGLPHAEARRRYERAHLLIDQLLAGWYGGLAVELMALGKPVVSHIREEDLAFIPHAMRRDIPVISATPASIHDVLEAWLRQPLETWRRKGEAARRFVEAWHDPLEIARRVKRDYEAALASR